MTSKLIGKRFKSQFKWNFSWVFVRIREEGSSEAERQSKENNQADKSLFVQELLLALWTEEEVGTKDPGTIGAGASDIAPPPELPKLSSVAPVHKEATVTPAVNGLTSNAPRVARSGRCWSWTPPPQSAMA